MLGSSWCGYLVAGCCLFKIVGYCLVKAVFNVDADIEIQYVVENSLSAVSDQDKVELKKQSDLRQC